MMRGRYDTSAYGRVRFYPLLTYKKSARPNPSLRNIVAATPRGKAATPPLRLHEGDEDDDDEDDVEYDEYDDANDEDDDENDDDDEDADDEEDDDDEEHKCSDTPR
jgi:hypothetical protein